MNLLITGGAGFIGSNFIRYILKKYPDYKIINLDVLTYAGNRDNLKDIEDDPRYGFVKGDVCDSEIVDPLVSRADVVLHFAAESHVDRSIEDPHNFLHTNIFGTHILLEAAKRYGIEKFIYTSTDEVYGSVIEGSSREGDLLRPNSPYAVSKAGADMLCRAFYITYKVPIIITRSSNNFGPYQHPEKLIPRFITNLLRGRKIPLYGNGLNVRDWIYVLDNCSGIDTVLHKGKIGEVYNIGGGNERTNLDITKIILQCLGKDESFIEYVKDRPGHDYRYSLDCTKIRELGWMSSYNFEESMRETIQWYQENEEWWKKIVQSDAKASS